MGDEPTGVALALLLALIAVVAIGGAWLLVNGVRASAFTDVTANIAPVLVVIGLLVGIVWGLAR
jgi:Flp pilus assembly pilin Flp